LIEKKYVAQVKEKLNWENIPLIEKIGKRLQKYKRRLADDLKIKFKKIEPEYDLLLNNITNNLLKIDWNINPLTIQKIHKLLFPKWIYWETFSLKWERYYAHYSAGEYRTKDEFVVVDNKRYDYLNHSWISDSLDNLLNWYYNENNIEPFTKIIIFYIFFCEIHPFYNWNWTTWLILAEYFLYENKINFCMTDFYNTLDIKKQLNFFKKWISWNYDTVFEILIKK
jgi:fido (protein-threonine AMPylation protein)